MNYWLVKSEPGTYSWEKLIKDGRTSWEGVRNYQARNNLKEMKKEDVVLFYHSNEGMEIVGIARVAKEFYPDPTINDERWVTVDIEPVSKLKNSVTLQTVKNDSRLQEMALVRTSRLSVMPVKKEEFDIVMELAG